MVSNAQSEKPNLIVPIAVIAALAPIIGGVIWYVEHTPASRPQPPLLTDAAREYTGNLKLSEVNMKATANYVGAAVVEVTGRITNNGARPLSLVELNCVFYDPHGMVVLRQRVPIVRRRLEPGQTRDFRLPFEGIPQSWNQALPQLVIANIDFAG